MHYELINPSDKMTIEAEDDRIAGVVGLLVGNGKVGVESKAGALVLPILAVGGEPALNGWLQQAEIDDLQDFVDDNVEEIAACLESILYGGFADRKGIETIIKEFTPEDRRTAFEDWNDVQRSSLNDYSSYCFKLADALREKMKSE